MAITYEQWSSMPLKQALFIPPPPRPPSFFEIRQQKAKKQAVAEVNEQLTIDDELTLQIAKKTGISIEKVEEVIFLSNKTKRLDLIARKARLQPAKIAKIINLYKETELNE